MEELKELQKNEALNRLRILQMNFELLENVVTEFEQDDKLYYSEYINQNLQGILYYVSNKEEFTNAIKEFEEKHQAKVYHAILTPLTYGTMLSLLYVSQYTEEWKRDRRPVKNTKTIKYKENNTFSSRIWFGFKTIYKWH